MALEVDYLPVATSGTANVDPQSSFAGSPYQLNGFVDGIASPQQANKIWRQASMMGAMLANFISGTLNISVLDDGNLPNLINVFFDALRSIIAQATVGFQPALGFVPVQEGTGTGQFGNTIKIGWNNVASLLGQVDNTPLGAFVFEPELIQHVTTLNNEDTNLQTQINVANANIAALSFSGHTLAQQGHQTLPGGLIFIWGTVTQDINGGQLPVSFAPSGISFPNNCFNVTVSTLSTTDRITYVVNGSITKNGFTVGNNGSSGFATWFAIGN